MPDICHNLGIVFFRIPKVASTTIVREFQTEPSDKDFSISYLNYDKIALVRNPFDRLVSLYFHPFNPQNVKGKSFEDFIERVCLIPDSEADKHFKSQTSLIPDYVKVFKIEERGKFEDFIKEKMREHGIRAHFSFNTCHNSTVRRDYEYYFDEKTIPLVEERYSRDLALFGYKYGD